MVTTYQPKNSYFTPERVQKSIKDLITTCYKDREQMLTHYTYLMDAYEKDTENTALLQEATKTLNVIIKSTEKIVKLLDMVSKHLDKSDESDDFDKLNIDTKSLQSFLDQYSN